MPPEALMVCPEPPYPLAGGGALRTASLLNYLARRYTVDLVVFREPGAPDASAAIPLGLVRDVHTIALPRHSRSWAARAIRNGLRFLRGVPPLLDRFGNRAEAIAGALGGRRYKLAVVEHFWCAPYVGLLARHAERVVLDLHNIESCFHTSCAAAEPWPVAVLHARFAAASARLERRFLPQFDCVLVASEEDEARACRLAPGVRVQVYPNALPAADRPCTPEEYAIAFSGNFEYGPNAGAVRFFARQIWPQLRERHPGLKWRLIGSHAAAVRRHIAGDARIEVRENPSNAVAELAAACIVVVPLLAGSGTRLKILEAWAAERAVVSTPIGAEGLGARDGEHIVIAGPPDEFVNAVSRLLADPGARARIGAAGRRLFEERYTWQRAWAALEL
ncbi:MAG: glycosyltransferase family 4 protein [bacterium]|jgi:glycosyltransferase involved in cell wall biosynthesis